jgi:predicted nucleic acid-binding protein
VRLFLDANVLFTAPTSPEGASQAVVRLASQDRCVLSSSRFAIDEATRNVVAKRASDTAALHEIVATVHVVAEPGPRTLTWATDHVASKDAPILAAAVSARVDVLVTGDRRHIGRWYGATLGGVTIERPWTALRLVLDGEG